jgi:TolA-binding protein
MKRAARMGLPVFLLLFLAGEARASDADAGYEALLGAWKNKEYARALDASEAFLKEHPDYKYASAVLYIGGNSGLRTKQYDRAEPMYRALLERFPSYKKARASRDELASVLSGARRLDECIAQCEANLEADGAAPRAPRWRYLIAQTLFRQWKFIEAKRALEAFIEKHAGSPHAKSAQIYLGWIDPPWDVDENGVIRGYDGKYAGDVRFQKALKALPRYKTEAYATLQERLGVDLRGKTGVLFLFEDAGDKSRGGLRGNTYTVAVKGKPVEVILFYTEYVVLSPDDFRKRITHEMKHAGFRGWMGQVYLGLPRWVREGLAVYGAEQVRSRVDSILGNEVFAGSDPMKVLDGIDDPDHDFNDYLEDALAFEWLESLKEGNVHAYCKGLIAGKDPRALFGEQAGRPWPDALKEAQAYCEKRVRETLGTGLEAYLEIRSGYSAALAKGLDAHGKWLDAGGEKSLEDWLEKNAGHAIEPNVRYRLGKSLVYAGRYEKARTWLEKVVSEDFDRSTVCDDAMFWIARSFELENKKEEAARAYGVLLRDYSWSKSAKKVKGDRKPAGPVME